MYVDTLMTQGGKEINEVIVGYAVRETDVREALDQAIPGFF